MSGRGKNPGLTADDGLELAIADLRRYCQRLPDGTVTLRVIRRECMTLEHDLDVDRLTPEDYDRLMRQRPHKEGKWEK